MHLTVLLKAINILWEIKANSLLIITYVYFIYEDLAESG